jgi:hypothetical protein
MSIMSMEKLKKVQMARDEAIRFLKITGKALDRNSKEEGSLFNTREMGAVRRASLDLSQALVYLRKN